MIPSPALAALIGLWLLAASIGLCAHRAMRGPSTHDRVMALDTLSVNLMGVIILASIRIGELHYLDFVPVLAILGFVTTLAMAVYLERGVIIQYDRR